MNHPDNLPDSAFVVIGSLYSEPANAVSLFAEAC